MPLLLDTQIYLWWLQNHPRLSLVARQRIMEATYVYVSSASIWEAAIKVGIGKLQVDIDQLVTEIGNSGFIELPISAKHAAKVAHLPHHHRDPFDRLLVAQALCDTLHLLTADKVLPAYSVSIELI